MLKGDENERRRAATKAELLTYLKSAGLKKAYRFVEISTSICNGDKEQNAFLKDTKIMMNMKDYPISWEKMLSKLDLLIAQKDIEDYLNLQPRFISTVGDPFEPFRAKKLGFDLTLMLEVGKSNLR